ncbi:V-set and immunoglobulin domain-containing protein 10-like isoform X1 [Dunckerocampus dactyliophorus]|uniref:V-set and immunoglobulin domain-containing protein 10-like isoform X1 n=1 Tax=Dunckerocampus dactyliophorus TaxID=161453 RepID=UPI002406553B|nr:V-set and immunoglobulin domain-containing protein 10-like isoform X1 [Dunckerocampus dactyliophorus]
MEELMLRYSMLRGVVEEQLWFFNGRPLPDSPRYTVLPSGLAVRGPGRNDTGRYTVALSNPFSSKTAHVNVTVLYGPDEPIIQVSPARDFYVSGDSLTLSCQADGSPRPTVEWMFGDQALSLGQTGVLNLSHVQTTQGGDYTCMLLNHMTAAQRHKSISVHIYERPPGHPTCSVLAEDNVHLRYECRWPGGTPPARLSFPDLINASSGLENFTLTVKASHHLDGKSVTCEGIHPVGGDKCNISAKSPVDFFPAVRTQVDSEGKIVVSISCVSEATPPTVVSWFRGGEAVIGDGAENDISDGTARLIIRHHNVSVLLLHNYTCTCTNALGRRSRHLHLQEPSISAFGLFPHQDGTVVTLTWEVPPTSIVTGFDIQMSGPDLPSVDGNHRSGTYRTILPKPSSARSADISDLDPKATYRFRVVPRALMAEGQPTVSRRIGPGEGLSGPAVAGIAAGIPCSIVFLLLVCSLIYLLLYWSRMKSHQTRYPVSRAANKVQTTHTQTPHNLLVGGPKSPPDYDRLQQAPSSLSVAPPSFVPPPPPVRVATTFFFHKPNLPQVQTFPGRLLQSFPMLRSLDPPRPRRPSFRSSLDDLFRN